MFSPFILRNVPKTVVRSSTSAFSTSACKATRSISNALITSNSRLPCALTLARARPHTQTQTQSHRSYATKNKSKATSTLVPGSKQPIQDEAARAEYAKAETAMTTSVEWFRKECAVSEGRAVGRVTPAMLSPVRVKLPDSPQPAKLEDLATIGVREGSTLLITLFDEHTIKHVEAALYESGIPGVVPHRQDNRTIKVPIPKPTVEARKELYDLAKRKAEEIRVQIRKHHAASLKRGKYGKHTIELEEFQKLTDKYIKETDKILADLQKATASK